MNAVVKSADDIIGIEHQTAEISNILVVDWSLGNTCNYKCTYCPPETHSGSHPFMDIEQVLTFSRRINQHYKEGLGREICFLYTGGEVTIFKDFIPLIKAQSEAGNRIGISTNGSRAVSYWHEARKYLDYVSISFHSDHTRLNHFIRVINAIKDHVQTHVNIMVKPEYFDRCIEAAYRVHEETSEVTIDVQIVLENFQRPFSYTDEQREKIMSVSREINSNLKLTRERKPFRGLMKLRYADNSEQLIKAGDIIIRKLNAWKGWQCNVGIEELVVNMHGDIFPSWCGKVGRIGNVRDAQIEFPKSGVICPEAWCPGGISDIMVSKTRMG
ncbi:MAG: radical SAM protein [Steroidobacter sp.]